MNARNNNECHPINLYIIPIHHHSVIVMLRLTRTRQHGFEQRFSKQCPGTVCHGDFSVLGKYVPLSIFQKIDGDYEMPF